MERIVEIDEPLLDETKRQQGDESFAHGVEIHERVGLPWSRTSMVEPTANQVDSGTAVDKDAHSCANLAPLREVAYELVPDTEKPDIARTGDRYIHRRSIPPAGSGGLRAGRVR